jgi:hypothetical protein
MPMPISTSSCRASPVAGSQFLRISSSASASVGQCSRGTAAHQKPAAP